MNKTIKAKLERFESTRDDRFVSCKVVVCHDQDNLNGSYFDKDDMLRCAELTLRECPILGSVVTDDVTGENRLNGHDMDYDFVIDEETGQMGVEVHHIERIYGFIPHDARISMEYDPQYGKYFIVTDGVLWKNYLDEVGHILKRQDGQCDVSMEIDVDPATMSDMREGYTQIKDFKFLGITMLNDSPAMVGANLQVAECFAQNKIETGLQAMMQEYSRGGEEVNEEKVETIEEQFEETTEEKVEEVVEEIAEVTEKVEAIEEEVKTIEEEVVVEEDKTEEYEELKQQYDELKAEYEAFKEQVSDYAELKEFKENYDNAKYKAEIEEITSEFGNLTEEDYSELKEKALAKEITKEQYEEKLALKEFMKNKNSKKKFSKKETSEIQIISDVESDKKSRPYGGAFDKYLNK